MDPGPSSLPHTSAPLKERFIQSGNNVLMRTPNGDVKSQKIEKDATVVLGRLGSFLADDLIGQPFGLAYEIVDKRLKVMPPRTLEDVEDTDATNELINDGEFVQPLTLEEIEALKQSGVHASDIIKKQIEQHANYSLKTEYSKEKYKKRKEAKYSKSFTTVEPTLFNVCEYWFNKDHSRIRDIRIDTLSQMLNMANIRPGGRYIAVDDASGMVVSGILERLGGDGRLITICDVDSPPAYPVMTQMNFKKESFTAILSSLNWATVQEDYTPILPPAEPSDGKFHSERQKSRLNKRKALTNNINGTREELFNGEFDGLIIASEYDPYSIVEKLYPYLAGSAPIVAHSPSLQILADLQAKTRSLPGYLGPTVSEAWLRRYQVLPGRTHPTMNTSGSGGFLFSVIKVYDDPNASSVMAHRQHAKKQKRELSAGEVIAEVFDTNTVASETSTVHLSGHQYGSLGESS